MTNQSCQFNRFYQAIKRKIKRMQFSIHQKNGGSTLAKHLYIIDTCVLLHDPFAIYKFAENDIYIPLAVIDDLDDIKTRKDNVAWSAREVFRQLENFTLQDLLKGVKINENNGRLFVITQSHLY